MKNLILIIFALFLIKNASANLSVCGNAMVEYNCELNAYTFSSDSAIGTTTWIMNNQVIGTTINQGEFTYQFPTSGMNTIYTEIDGVPCDTLLSQYYFGLDVLTGFTAWSWSYQPVLGSNADFNLIYQGNSVTVPSEYVYSFSPVFNGVQGAQIHFLGGSVLVPGTTIIGTVSFNPSVSTTFTGSVELCLMFDGPNNDQRGPQLCCDKPGDITIEVPPSPCCSNFSPDIGERYWMSAWVKEIHPNQVKTYEDSYVEFEFVGNTNTAKFYTTGDIIDGWQRIVGDFTIPSNTTDLKIHLVNSSGELTTYFDDVRVHPFNASMKSYVYDPVTLWLTAELDDNNYATFYEYDTEGQLIRIKKETSRGIMTIQESRSSNPKSE